MVLLHRIFGGIRATLHAAAAKLCRRRPSAPAAVEPAHPLSALDTFDRRASALARVIAAPEELLPRHRGVDFGHAMVEYDGRYRYLFVERGERYDEQVTADIEEVLYWTFRTVTRAMAGEHAAIHREPNAGDIRRLLFAHQLMLLGRLNPDWAARRRAELDALLRHHPYIDA